MAEGYEDQVVAQGEMRKAGQKEGLQKFHLVIYVLFSDSAFKESPLCTRKSEVSMENAKSVHLKFKKSFGNKENLQVSGRFRG